jgi:hypothetical protein
MLIKQVTKPRVFTKFVIVEADLIYVSIKLKCVSHNTARQEATLSPQNTQQNRSGHLTSKREKRIKINLRFVSPCIIVQFK